MTTPPPPNEPTSTPPASTPSASMPPTSTPPTSTPRPPVPYPPAPPVPAQHPGYPTGGYQVPGAPPPGYPGQRPVPVSPGGQPLAEFADRLVALIIDGLILGAISLVIILPVYFVAFLALLPSTTVVNGRNVGPSEADVAGFVFLVFGIFFFVLLLSLLIGYLYEVEYMLRNGGQTVGKRVMKLRVVPIDPAQPLTRVICFKRFLVQRVASIIPAFSWVDGLWQLWDQPYRQCLHDKYAKTVVIKIVA